MTDGTEQAPTEEAKPEAPVEEKDRGSVEETTSLVDRSLQIAERLEKALKSGDDQIKRAEQLFAKMKLGGIAEVITEPQKTSEQQMDEEAKAVVDKFYNQR